jgi:hypothetical protein
MNADPKRGRCFSVIELCGYCLKQHEVENYVLFGVPVKTCPEIRSDETPIFSSESAHVGEHQRPRQSGRPGVGKDGAAGVTVQMILPKEAADALDAWAARNGIGRGPAARKIISAFFGEGWSNPI